MQCRRKIRVLVVDDSLLFRETLVRGLAGDSGLQIVGTASDPFVARDKILALEPDVMTLDVEMPRMNGIEFLRRLMPQYPIPVVMISGFSENVFEALNAGAVDFVVKPEIGKAQTMESMINELIIKIKIAAAAKVGYWKKQPVLAKPMGRVRSGSGDGIIAIGASTGGTEAVFKLLKSFTPEIPGIVIVQHMPAGFTKMYAERINNSCTLEVKEARNGDMVHSGRALLAPGDCHMKIKKYGNGYMVECKPGEKVNGHCPSVDVLFNSVADQAGGKAVGIILTGMGRDGAKGLLAMRKKGAKTIGQDEQSCVVYGMPKAAFDIGAVEKQMSLENMPQALSSLLNRSFTL